VGWTPSLQMARKIKLYGMESLLQTTWKQVLCGIEELCTEQHKLCVTSQQKIRKKPTTLAVAIAARWRSPEYLDILNGYAEVCRILDRGTESFMVAHMWVEPLRAAQSPSR
jgi:hypothetical protein